MRLSVDRIEGGVAVCYDDGGKKYEIPADGLSEGLLIEAKFGLDGEFISATILTEETDARRKEMAARTKNLFNRKKK